MVWVQFQTEKDRDEAMKKMPKANCKMGTTKIWIDKDLPYEERQLVASLLAIRKNCVDRKLAKAALWVDKDTYSLSYYDDFIIGLSIDEKKLHWEFGED